MEADTFTGVSPLNHPTNTRSPAIVARRGSSSIVRRTGANALPSNIAPTIDADSTVIVGIEGHNATELETITLVTAATEDEDVNNADHSNASGRPGRHERRPTTRHETVSHGSNHHDTNPHLAPKRYHPPQQSHPQQHHPLRSAPHLSSRTTNDYDDDPSSGSDAPRVEAAPCCQLTWIRALLDGLRAWVAALHFPQPSTENDFVLHHHYDETTSPWACAVLAALVLWALGLALVLGLPRVSARYLTIMSFTAGGIQSLIAYCLWVACRKPTPAHDTSSKSAEAGDAHTSSSVDVADQPNEPPRTSWMLVINAFIVTPSECLMVVSASVMFVFFFMVVVVGKSPEYCDALDTSSCARTIRNNGALFAVYLVTIIAYRLRAVVQLPLMIFWSIVYIVGVHASPGLAWQLQWAASVMVVVVCMIAGATTVLMDRASRRHYLSKSQLAAEQQSAAALSKFYTSIVSSMIPEQVSLMMARGEVARLVLERSVVCCVGLLQSPASIVASRGPAVLVATLQQCALAVDSAMQRAAVCGNGREAALSGGSAASPSWAPPPILKGHAFGDSIELCFTLAAASALLPDGGAHVSGAASFGDDQGRLTPSTVNVASSHTTPPAKQSPPPHPNYLAAFLFHLAVLARGRSDRRSKAISFFPQPHSPSQKSPATTTDLPTQAGERHSRSPPLNLNESNVIIGEGQRADTGRLTSKESVVSPPPTMFCVALAVGDVTAVSIKKNFSLSGRTVKVARKVLRETQLQHRLDSTRRSDSESVVLSTHRALPRTTVDRMMTASPQVEMNLSQARPPTCIAAHGLQSMCAKCTSNQLTGHDRNLRHRNGSFTDINDRERTQAGAPQLSDDDSDGATPTDRTTQRPPNTAEGGVLLWELFRCTRCHTQFGARNCSSNVEGRRGSQMIGSVMLPMMRVVISDDDVDADRKATIHSPTSTNPRPHHRGNDDDVFVGAPPQNDSLYEVPPALHDRTQQSPHLIVMTPLPPSLAPSAPLVQFDRPPTTPSTRRRSAAGSLNPLEKHNRFALQPPQPSLPPGHPVQAQEAKEAQNEQSDDHHNHAHATHDMVVDESLLTPIFDFARWFPVKVFIHPRVEAEYQQWVLHVSDGDANTQKPLDLPTATSASTSALVSAQFARSFAANALFGGALFLCFVFDGAETTRSSLLLIGAVAVSFVSSWIPSLSTKRVSLTPDPLQASLTGSVNGIAEATPLNTSLVPTATTASFSSRLVVASKKAHGAKGAAVRDVDVALPYYWILDVVFFVLVCFAYALITESSPVADSNPVWSLGVLLLLCLRNRFESVIACAALDISSALLFVALTWATGPSTRLRKDVLSMTLPLTASLGMSTFRFTAELARRRRFVSDSKLAALQKEMQRDAVQLAHLLRQMVPDQTTDNGRLFAKLLEAIRGRWRHGTSAASQLADGTDPVQEGDTGPAAAASVGRKALSRLPKLFGIRASLFASPTVDRPLLLAECGSPSSSRLPADKAVYDHWMATVDGALADVTHVKLVKTDGDLLMFVDEQRHLDVSCMSLLAFISALRLRGSVASKPSLSARCALVAGPVMGGVLGTAALSFEYFGEPVETGRRLLGREGDLLWTAVGGAPLPSSLQVVATSRYCEWLQWGLITDAAVAQTRAALAVFRRPADVWEAPAPKCILHAMIDITASTSDSGAPFVCHTVIKRDAQGATNAVGHWLLGQPPSLGQRSLTHPRSSLGLSGSHDRPRGQRSSPIELEPLQVAHRSNHSPQLRVSELSMSGISRHVTQGAAESILISVAAAAFRKSFTTRLTNSVSVVLRHVAVDVSNE